MLRELRKAKPAMRKHGNYVRDFPNGLEVVVQMHVEGPYCRVWMACRPGDAKVFAEFTSHATRKGYVVEIDDDEGIPAAFISLAC